ncbi:MAG: hypothetical protein FWE38_05280 [Firmicutes bacterium]|nr:hypothetical protein [Bacillota bacterium]
MPSKIENQAELDVQFCGESLTVESNTVVANRLDVVMVKTQSCDYFMKGSIVTFCVEIKNNGNPLELPMVFRDKLYGYVEYVDGSFTVDGVSKTPEFHGNELTYRFNTLNKSMKLCFKVKVKS